MSILVRIRLRCDLMLPSAEHGGAPHAFAAGELVSTSSEEALRLIGASAAELLPDADDAPAAEASP